MIAVDTNVLARFYVDDPTDPEARAQRPLARELFERGEPLFVPVTVVLELEWVTRAFYRLAPEQFAGILRHLTGLPHVQVETWPAVQQAVDWHLEGLDFADALHLARSGHCDGLATFDRGLARGARNAEAEPEVTLVGA